MRKARTAPPPVGALVWYEPVARLKVLCLVRGSRACYGRVDVEIEPARGAGAAWVQQPTITPLTEAEAKKEIE